MKRLALLSISLYRSTWRFRSPSCRFYPSCSAYAYQAIERHGVFKGSLLALMRIGRCHPLCAGGIDEVPADFGFGLKQPGCAGHLHATETYK